MKCVMLSKQCYSPEYLWYGFLSDRLYRDVYTLTVVKSTMKSKGKAHSIFKTVIVSKDRKLYIGRDQWRLRRHSNPLFRRLGGTTIPSPVKSIDPSHTILCMVYFMINT